MFLPDRGNFLHMQGGPETDVLGRRAPEDCLSPVESDQSPFETENKISFLLEQVGPAQVTETLRYSEAAVWSVWWRNSPS